MYDWLALIAICIIGIVWYVVSGGGLDELSRFGEENPFGDRED